MPEPPFDNMPRGRLRAFYEWLARAAPPQASSKVAHVPRQVLRTRLGHYAITGKLGEGGMGVVYKARDDRLGRNVALKTMTLATDETAQKRFWREARAAAAVNHPNICQIYEIGEEAGELFIAMELLEGESLADRLRRGPLNVSETVQIGLEMLAALSALHGRSIVHRDLKPSNVFVTPHGVKLLDFGLARTPFDPLEQSLASAAGLTRTGIVVGTPQYMAPEQITGDSVDARTDLFAAGAIMFESLAGRPPFTGRTIVEVLHATVYEQPPALTGSPAVAALDRVIRHALAKLPVERPASADEMARELRRVRPLDGGDTSVVTRALTRLMVLPFRVLRPDPETDFLAFSLSDAIATSLSRSRSLIVRSSATASRFAGESPDLAALAAEADVDQVVMGTMLRSGEQLRVAVQLVETPSGTLLTSHVVQSSLGDLFGLQDDIARRVVEVLSLPLTGPEPTSISDIPHNARAYEFYLRAKELARTYDGLASARGLYQRCLDLDPHFAPAWAELGRCHRVIGKYIEGSEDSETRAEEAFRRALELNPGLSAAHKFYANLEADIGQSGRALVRLLAEASRHGNDPELFAGLVHACRYCGLFEHSVVAHAEARRLDPNVFTSFAQTLLMMGDLERLVSAETLGGSAGADDRIRIIGLGLLGRGNEARRALLAGREGRTRVPALESWTAYLMSWLDRRADEMLVGLSALTAFKIQEDPESIFREGWLLCDVGEYQQGLVRLRQAVDKGYFVAPTLSAARAFEPLRTEPAFQAILLQAELGRQQSLTAFREAFGERLLGP